jgi:hypothetical protein
MPRSYDGASERALDTAVPNGHGVLWKEVLMQAAERSRFIAFELALAATLTVLGFVAFFSVAVARPGARLWRWLRADLTGSTRAVSIMKSSRAAEPREPFRRTARRARRRLRRTIESISAGQSPAHAQGLVHPNDLSRFEGEGGMILPPPTPPLDGL